MIELSLILPVHNESVGIELSLKVIQEAINSLGISYEIICVENGSTDSTFQILQTLEKSNKHIPVLRSDIGWGNAVRAGVGQARGKVTCYMVSDGQIEAKYIIDLYNLYNRYKRFPELKEFQFRESKNIALFKILRTSRENPARMANSQMYNKIAQLLFGIGSKDINATPKLIETDLLKSIPLHSNNIALDLELLLTLKKRSLTWLEIPAPSKVRESGTSTTKLKSVWEMLRYMIKFKFQRW